MTVATKGPGHSGTVTGRIHSAQAIFHKVYLDDATRSRLLGMLAVEVECFEEFTYHEKDRAKKALLQADLAIIRRTIDQLKNFKEVPPGTDDAAPMQRCVNACVSSLDNRFRLLDLGVYDNTYACRMCDAVIGTSADGPDIFHTCK